jgi:hypothetical protein
MLENLLNLVKSQIGGDIEQTQVIPNEHNEQAMQLAGSSLLDTLKGAAAGGGLKDILSMFAQGDVNPQAAIAQQASGNFAQSLTDKLGINMDQALGLAGTLIPKLMQGFAQQTADPNNQQFQAQDILNQLSGGKTSGFDIGGLMSKFQGGLDKDGDGDVDMQDLQRLFQ